MLKATPPAPDQSAYDKARKADELSRLKDEESMSGVSKTPDGRHLLNLILDICGVEFASGSPFREGQRDVGLKIKALMDAVDVNLYASLLVERTVRPDQRQTAVT